MNDDYRSNEIIRAKLRETTVSIDQDVKEKRDNCLNWKGMVNFTYLSKKRMSALKNLIMISLHIVGSPKSLHLEGKEYATRTKV
jgi:hypothetical protein